MIGQQAINEKIDRLLHDAEQAQAGSAFAARIGHVAPAAEMQEKYRRLKAEAEKLFLENPGSEWPDCEWPKPVRGDITKVKGRTI